MWPSEIVKDTPEMDERRIPAPEELLRVLSDEHTFKVLSILQVVPSTVKYISEVKGLSLIGCYRRIRCLTEMGLVRSCGKRKGSYTKKETLFEVGFQKIWLEFNSNTGIRMVSSDGPDIFQRKVEPASIMIP